MSYSFAFISVVLRKKGRKHPILYGMENEHTRGLLIVSGVQFAIVHQLPRIVYYTIDLCTICKNPCNKMAFEMYNKQT